MIKLCAKISPTLFPPDIMGALDSSEKLTESECVRHYSFLFAVFQITGLGDAYSGMQRYLYTQPPVMERAVIYPSKRVSGVSQENDSNVNCRTGFSLLFRPAMRQNLVVSYVIANDRRENMDSALTSENS